MFKKSPLWEPPSPVSSNDSVPPISTIHKASGGAGKACILNGERQSWNTIETFL